MQESLDLAHLELLVALRTTGNLGRAAGLLSISPSAASHRLREAERRLDIALTRPVGRSLTLTPAALHLAEVAATVRTALRSAEETARWMTSAARPAARIALDFHDTAPWFEPLTARDDLPCDVDFVRVTHDATADAVAEGRVDLGVIVVAADVAEVGDVVGSDQLTAVVRADHPAAARGELVPGDISDATYATAGDRPAHGFEHHRFFEPAGVRPHSLRKVESLAMILRLLRRYGGITVQPTRVLAVAPLDGLTLVPLADTTIEVRYEVLRGPAPGIDIDGVIDVIRRVVADTPMPRGA